MPSHEPLNRPGRIELFTSATTVTVIVFGVTPTSGLVSFAVLQASGAAAVVDGPPRPPPPPPPPEFLLLPPPQAVTTSTKAVARTHQRSRILSPPGSLDGPKRTDIVHACRSETQRGLRERSASVGKLLTPGLSNTRPDSRVAGIYGKTRRCRCRNGTRDDRGAVAWQSRSLRTATRRAPSPPSRTIGSGRACGSSRARSTTWRTRATSTSSGSGRCRCSSCGATTSSCARSRTRAGTAGARCARARAWA